MFRPARSSAATIWRAIFAAGLPFLLPALAVAEPTRPNIVFVIADDLGIADLSCYGRRDQPTVNLDRLAAEGMRFTTAYAAQSVCSPTRAAIMTGKTPARLHLTTFLLGRPDAPSQLLQAPAFERQLPLAEKTIAEYLREAGYVSACIGKWHLGEQGLSPVDQGFDLYQPGTANTQPSATEGGKGEYDLTAKAEAFIEANRDRPFFLYLGHNSPHIPLAARPEAIARHRDAFHPLYAAMIETLDDSVGRLIQKIDGLGLAERTCVVFTSDNGGVHVLEGAAAPPTHNAPYRAGKGFLYEGGLRVPLIVRWPGVVAPASLAESPVISTDWFPTLLAIAGLATPEPCDGASLHALLAAGQPLAPRRLYWHQPHYMNQGSRPCGAIREGDWKLIERYEDGGCELFNLARDVGESSDVSAEFPARVAELRGLLEAWRRETHAQTAPANADFNSVAWRRIYRDFDPSAVRPLATAAATAPQFAAWRKAMDEAIASSFRPSAAPLPAGPGALVLPADTAIVHGKTLRYESAPAKDTLGFWTVAADFVEWDFELPKAGDFDVEALYGCGTGSGGAEVEFALDDAVLTMKVAETGHFQRFVPQHVGTVRKVSAGRHTLRVRARAKPAAAVMDLRRVTLRAAGAE
ncbi:MAG TPA: sulfatase-like hydrolase/transferase [Pirellulales bacterium]|nr:sulfatase-like hydrolase/transferase [Pirellulales bacterium]